ncbi:hypothetical protein ElyMa_006727400 [Elysia marginata]|uniref:RHD domain-containing protein n=1 Tax=Elysia marginata TaxID=1093978 RepID=A0AAV4ISX6_9GAST|nr:hypothetical protein ElyMa_006727400 [Elysia marginata]
MNKIGISLKTSDRESATRSLTVRPDVRNLGELGLAPINNNIGSKISAKQLPSEEILKMTGLVPDHPSPSSKPSVEIIKCISFQKFRYSGENRPGKKYQEKEFMTLQLNNLAEKVVRVIIICTDADNRELIHPNGLVGKDCHHGIYDKDYVVSKPTYEINQGGEYNGSLHAISHMVCNASEKTSLEIYKLSHLEVSAWNGREIDIFTNEDGPAIEPDKCLVYVTLCDVPGAEEWKSDVFSPRGEDILYKKVIKYKVPPIAPNYDISAPAVAMLHLECPQSNQYCCTEFKYMPLDTGYVCIDNLSPSNSKRSFEELQSYEDVKPIVKKARVEVEGNDSASELVKANLKSKLRARQENSHSGAIEQNDVMEGSDRDGEHFVVDPTYSPQQKNLPRYPEQQHVYIRHEDPQTGEASYLLDMDASKRSHSGHGSPFQAHSQDVKVVATGYSDAVPPNTTVFIYTTNNEGTEQVAMGAEHVILEDPTFIQGSQSDYRGKENKQEIETEKFIGAASNLTSAQIVRRDTIASKQMHESLGQTFAVYKNEEDAPGVTKENLSPLQPQYSYVLTPTSKSLLANTYGSGSCSPSPNKTSSAIPDIRRMVIPSKRLSEASPWEVGGPEDAEAYSMCAEAMNYEQHRQPAQPTSMKTELTDSPRTSLYVAASELESHEHNFKATEETYEKAVSITSHSKDSFGKSNVKSPKSMGLNSYLEGAVVNTCNLPTFEVSQIAEVFENGNVLDQVDAEAE